MQEQLNGTLSNTKIVSKISHVGCREIQAPLMVTLIKGFGQEMGLKRALETATRILEEDAANAAHKLASQYGGNSMSHLARIIREVWAEDGALVMNVLRETDSSFDFNVTWCGYADCYQRLGLIEFGVCLSCCRDKPWTVAFNPRIVLTRSQTIMEGAPYCDFRFSYK
ncbi:MAG: L-2-amino-thiazoline-4-carboxylic acid hydrolase [Firmicutes bacterium]|nr:L-2-amino-thiazoline-4-carboxylic acid hydrolase [Bacillota bacterium]